MPPPAVVTFNDKVKKPKIGKISSSGSLSIKFDNLRLIENENDLDSSTTRILAFTEIHRLLLDSEEGSERIYGTESSGKNLPGLSMYIEPDEMSDA